MRIFIFLLFISSTSVFGQINFDSLKLEFENGTDSTKYFSAMELAESYSSQNDDSTLKYYELAFDACQKNDWYKRMGHIRFNEGMFYHFTLGSKKSMEYAVEAQKWYAKAEYSKGILNCYYTLGTYWGNFDQLDSAIHYLSIGRVYGEEISDSTYLHRIYNNLGLMYQYQGLNDKASEYFIKAITLKEKLNTPDVENTYHNLGLNYLNSGQYDLAIKYFMIAQKMFTVKEQFKGRAVSLKNIGTAFEEKNDLDSAVYYYDLAFQIFKELNDSNSISRYYVSMGDVFETKGENEKALASLDEALAMFPENGSSRLLVLIWNTQAQLELSTAKKTDRLILTNVVNQSLQSYNLAKKIGHLQGQVNASKLLFETYGMLGLEGKSNKYARKYIDLNDSLVNQLRVEANASQNAKFESVKKELEIEFLNKENALKTTEITQSKELQSKQQFIIYLLFGGVFLTGFFVLVIFRFYRNQRKFNKDLLSKNEVISTQKHEKDLLLKEIHHRVKNNLQIVWNLLDLQSFSITDEKVKTVINDGKNRVNSMAMIHTMLYQNDDAGNISFVEYVQNLTNQISKTHPDAERVNVEINIPTHLKFDIDTSVPLGLMITELFTNSLKYGIKGVDNPIITIDLKHRSQDDYTLVISDNGHGLPDGFEIRKSKSLGLKLVSNLGRQLMGKVEFENNNGAEFTITFKGKSFSIA